MVEAVNLLAHFNTWVQPLDVRKMRKEVDMTPNSTPVPEPSTWLLILIGLAALILWSRRAK